MSGLDLDAIEAQAKDSVLTEPSVGQVVVLLVAEVRRLRDDHHSTWRLLFKHWIPKSEHLQRRLQKLRRDLRHHGSLQIHAQLLAEDTERAKRFRKKQAARR